MISHHGYLVLSALLLLVSSTLARSIKDQNLQKEAAVEMMDGGAAAPFADDSQTLADFLDYLLAYRHVKPNDQPAVAMYRLESVKRAWPADGYKVPVSMKRKMFWTPLGHLPASARLGGRPQMLRANLEDSGSPVFRYG